MSEENIYQQALVKAIEQTVNGQLAVTEYITRLARMKAQRAFDGCIGRTFKSTDLKCEVMAVAVGYHVNTDVWKKLSRYYNDNQKEVVKVRIAFISDVDQLLESRKQLTEAERKYLKVLKKYRKQAEDTRHSKWYYRYVDNDEYEKVENIQQELYYELKNKLKVIDTACWSWDLSDILNDDFLTKGMSYDGQSICDNNKNL